MHVKPYFFPSLIAYGDVFGTLIIVMLHTVWWWLVLPRFFRTPRIAMVAKLAYFMTVVWATWDFDTLFSTPAQPAAFAGLAASALHLPNAEKLGRVERHCCYYSLAACLTVLVSGYFHMDDPLFFSQCWLLATVVVAWVHIRLNSFRRKPICWALHLSTFLFWVGIIATILGASALPVFLCGGLRGLMFSMYLIAIGILGALTVSVALSLELLSTPTPRTHRIRYGYGACLAWVVLNASLGLIR